MPKPKTKTMPRNRGWTVDQVCAYIGMSVGWWMGGGLKKLKKHGFPEPSAITGRYDRALVKAWYDQHSGIVQTGAITSGEDSWRQGLDALREGHEDHGPPAH